MESLRTYILLFALLIVGTPAKAQVGSYRNDLAIGFNGGYQLNTVAFMPVVQQDMMGGKNFGFTSRYVCEKYFNTICAVQIEVNYAQLGWKESILSKDDEPCILTKTGEAAAYTRALDYIQVPLLAQLGWGREVTGVKFLVQAGPQFGFLLSEKTRTNFSARTEDTSLPYYTDTNPERVSSMVAQDTMAVHNKFDYGITAGLGLEVSMKRFGHIILEGRYYYGLGCIFKDSKSDTFARSNHNSIVFKATYLFDIIRTRNAKRK